MSSLKSVLKVLPITSVIFHEDSPKNLKLSRKLFLGKCAYSLALGVWSLCFCISSGEINPVKQFSVIEAKSKRIEENRVYREQRERDKKVRYGVLWKELFVKPALADRNNNGAINFDERVDVWRRMGYFKGRTVIQGETKFPEPKLSDLEIAVRSYRLEKQSSDNFK